MSWDLGTVCGKSCSLLRNFGTLASFSLSETTWSVWFRWILAVDGLLKSLCRSTVIPVLVSVWLRLGWKSSWPGAQHTSLCICPKSLSSAFPVALRHQEVSSFRKLPFLTFLYFVSSWADQMQKNMNLVVEWLAFYFQWCMLTFSSASCRLNQRFHACSLGLVNAWAPGSSFFVRLVNRTQACLSVLWSCPCQTLCRRF